MRSKPFALIEALENEHSCDDIHGCDIGMAMEEGLYLWAGHLLVGATECPETDAALAVIRSELGDTFEAELERERDELCEVDHIACPKCNAIAWDPSELDVCPCCNASLNRHHVIRYVLTDEDNYGHVRYAIVAAQTVEKAREAWDSHVLDCTRDVWGGHVEEHYDTGSAEHSDAGSVYVMRDCDCGDAGCWTHAPDGEQSDHESLTTCVQWDPDGFVTFDTLDAAKGSITSEPGFYGHKPVIVTA